MALSELLGTTASEILENLAEVGDKYIDLEKIIPAVNDLLVDQASEIRKLNRELGIASRTTATFRGEIADLSAKIGVSIRDVSELVSSTNEYHQGILKSTKSTLLFTKAVGEVPKSLGDFSAKLTILGNISEESFTQMYKNILAVRNEYGLTSNQIDDIIEVMTDYATITQMSSDKMEKASLSVSKFVSQLTKAGMESRKTAELVKSMFDPEQLTDNLVLMQKIGISVNDMISGDPTEKLEGSVVKLKELGEEIANIAKTNRFQANEMAKVYGLTLEQATMLSQLDTSEKTLNTQKELDKYRSQMATFSESIKSLTSMVGGAIAGPLSFIGNIIQRFTDTMSMFPKGLIALLGGVTIKKLLNKLFEKTGRAAKRWGEKFSEPMAEYLNSVFKKYGIKQSDVSRIKEEKQKTNKDNKLDTSEYLGSRFYFKQARISEERSAAKRANKNDENLSLGEVIERIQEKENEAKKIDEKIKALEKEGKITEATYLKKLYNSALAETKDSARGKFQDLIKFNENQFKWGEGSEINEALNSFSKSKNEERRKENSKKLFEALNSDKMFSDLMGGFKFDENLNNEEQLKVADALKDASGPRETLNALKVLFKEMENTEGFEKIEAALKKLDAAAEESGVSVEEAKKVLEAYNEGLVANAKNITFRERAENLFKGFGLFLKNNIGKVLGFGAGGILLKIASSVSKNEKVSAAMSSITEKIGGVLSGWIEATEPLFNGLANLVERFVNWIQPAIDWIGDKLGKFSNWLGKKLDKNVTSIASGVATIEDSYKQEDLRTMIGGQAAYDVLSDTLATKLDNVVYAITGIGKKVDTTTDVIYMTGIK